MANKDHQERQNSPSRSGAFGSAVDKRVEKFTESIRFDRRLYRQDIRGSIAHAQMLADQDILTRAEAEQIETVLLRIESELDSGKFILRPELEDIHMNIEQALIDELGDVGRKLHTGRSRNDQVATDLRLWVRDSIDVIDGLLIDLQQAFVARCETDEAVILPAYTHLQRTACLGGPLLAGILRKTGPGSPAAGRLPTPSQPMQPWHRRAGRNEFAN